jgi:ubiquitin-protein ligase
MIQEHHALHSVAKGKKRPEDGHVVKEHIAHDTASSGDREQRLAKRIRALVHAAPVSWRPFRSRLTSELSEILKGNNDGTAFRPEGEDIQHWKALIHGPRGTPFEGGTFLLDVRIPDRYPWEPPSVRFATKVWHPDVCPDTGAICGDRLFEDAFPSSMTIPKVIICVQALLSGRVEDVAATHATASSEWHGKAQLWMQQYTRPQCGCELCQERAKAFAMGMHPRLGQHSPLAGLSGVGELAGLIDSFGRRAYLKKHFLGGWA